MCACEKEGGGEKDSRNEYGSLVKEIVEVYCVHLFFSEIRGIVMDTHITRSRERESYRERERER